MSIGEDRGVSDDVERCQFCGEPEPDIEVGLPVESWKLDESGRLTCPKCQVLPPTASSDATKS